MNSTVYIFKEFKEESLKYIKENEYFTHSSLPIPNEEWLGKTIILPFYTKSGKLIKNKKYVCVMSVEGYKWIEADTELGKPDLAMTFMDNSTKIHIPENHTGVVLNECVIEDEIMVEGELLIVDEESDIIFQEGDVQP